ncbi:MAG TPA: YeeE/YedE family protein [Rhodopila sp.]|nr:YeeE/YedE family protein [Rhodopila sp.]
MSDLTLHPSTPTTRTATPPHTPDWPVLSLAIIVALAVLGFHLTRHDPARAGLFLVAVALGWVFMRSDFSYTAAFRNLVARGNGTMLALAVGLAAIPALVIIPVTALTPAYAGYVSPLGLPVIAGAALFGAGMQLANGCASGSLYAAGAGSRRLWIAIPFFCAGGVLGSLMLPYAMALPSFPAIGLGQVFGPWVGLALTLALILGLAAILLRLPASSAPDATKLRFAGAIGVLAACAFLLWGSPWGVTMGLTVWGAKLAGLIGLSVEHTRFWQSPPAAAALHSNILQQPSSLMNIGVLLGAMLPAAWRGRFRAWQWPDARGCLAAAIGGLSMGVGARLAFGCNIGSLLGGLSSGSLHGVLWLGAALAGTWIGIRLRPRFGLSV